jgi:hypothetical protein
MWRHAEAVVDLERAARCYDGGRDQRCDMSGSARQAAHSAERPACTRGAAHGGAATACSSSTACAAA